MDFDIETFIRPQNLQLLKQTGLHKTAGVLNGIDEMTIKHAVALIGMKARQKRAEMTRIADGIAAYAELRGEKTAAMPNLSQWLPHIGHGVPAALLGTGIGYALSPDNDPEAQKKMMLQAGLLGLLGGTLHSVHKQGI